MIELLKKVPLFLELDESDIRDISSYGHIQKANSDKFLTDIAQYGEAASKRTITDELTGAYNRRFFDLSLQQNFDQSVNTGNPLSLMMIDLDHFKAVNSRYGEKNGDAVLQQVILIFQKHLNVNSILARFGGDELAVILPNTGNREAYTTADKVRQEISIMTFTTIEDPKRKFQISLSAGIAAYPGNCADIKELKENADQALYQAKNSGRNRVNCFGRN